MARLQATNSLGYGVQWLTKDGWVFWDDVVYDSLPSARKREEIVRSWALCSPDISGIETRVYEVLE